MNFSGRSWKLIYLKVAFILITRNCKILYRWSLWMAPLSIAIIGALQIINIIIIMWWYDEVFQKSMYLIFRTHYENFGKDSHSGQGNNIMVSISIYQADHPSSRPARSACFRKVEFYQNGINLFPPLLMTGSPMVAHVLSCHVIMVAC